MQPRFLALAAAFLLGCTATAERGDASQDAAPVPTWYGDIAPFAYTACGGCHVAGGIAPFDITNWDQVVARGRIIAAQTQARTMPPMPVDSSGACHTFSNARALTDAQIALIQAWAAHGMPAGDRALEPPRPTPPAGLTGASVHLDIGMTYSPAAPAGLTDEYRCFIVDPGVAADTYVTGYQVLPGDARIVHHVIVFSLADAAAESAAAALDSAAPGPGYECFGDSGVPGSEPLVLWAPGAGPTRFPNGTGLLLPGGHHVVVQIHYNLAAGSFPDRTRVEMTTGSAATTTRARFEAIAAHDLNLAPGMQSVSASSLTPLTGLPLPLRVYGVAPHMHQLGRTLHVETTSATPRCLVDTPRWDFHWQGIWWYDTPARVSPSDTIRLTCTFDTTSRTAVTHWGEGTADEMCLAFFYVAP